MYKERLIQNIEVYMETRRQVMIQFANYISDINIDLDKRWEIFLCTNKSLKNHDRYIHTFKWEQKYGEICWYSDFYCDRYSIVGMDMIIDSMQDRKEKYTEEMVNNMKEEILSENLGSFINDW